MKPSSGGGWSGIGIGWAIIGTLIAGIGVWGGAPASVPAPRGAPRPGRRLLRGPRGRCRRGKLRSPRLVAGLGGRHLGNGGARRGGGGGRPPPRRPSGGPP